MTESVKATQIAPEEITKKDVTKAYLRWQSGTVTFIRNDADFTKII